MPGIHRSSLITIRNIKIALALLGVLAIVGYFGYTSRFLGAPTLRIEAPSGDISTDNPKVEIKGKTDADADLTVNGRPLYSGETGTFADTVYLTKGVNRLEFESKNRYGRVSRIVRYVVLK